MCDRVHAYVCVSAYVSVYVSVFVRVRASVRVCACICKCACDRKIKPVITENDNKKMAGNGRRYRPTITSFVMTAAHDIRSSFKMNHLKCQTQDRQCWTDLPRGEQNATRQSNNCLWHLWRDILHKEEYKKTKAADKIPNGRKWEKKYCDWERWKKQI